ncbi:hypothetical protein BLOT_016572 [Blomia tropicalis]|nr:hypothetical protein BLOT_016572 [Blomia tropicalis]
MKIEMTMMSIELRTYLEERWFDCAIENNLDNNHLAHSEQNKTTNPSLTILINVFNNPNSNK